MNQRVVFLDLARLFALFMMLQGHTIYDTLADEYRNVDYPVYATWRFMRGFTAPVFLFVAGAVLVFLLEKTSKPNIRLKKGIKRAIILLLLGYWLNSSSFFYQLFSDFSFKRGTFLFRVDVLHLIGIGLLVLLSSFFVFRKFNLPNWLGYLCLFFLVGGLTPLLADINYENKGMLFLTQYINNENGSLFPVFPWLCYMLAGASFGAWIGIKKDLMVKSMQTGFLIIGISITCYFLSDLLTVIYGNDSFWNHYLPLVFYRLSYVIFIMGLFSLIGQRIKKLPNSLMHFSKNTLWIYVAHLLVLGWLKEFRRTLDPWESVGLAIGMIISMFFVSLLIEKATKHSKILTFLLK